jgi:hypothetical protein
LTASRSRAYGPQFEGAKAMADSSGRLFPEGRTKGAHAASIEARAVTAYPAAALDLSFAEIKAQ